VIEKILPDTVACAEAFTDPPGATLFPQEAALVSRVTDKRRREFTAGRECARLALGKLGVPPAPILTGERGAPRWPPGIVGSITHCDGYRAAAVGHAGDVAAIGLDAEPDGPLPRGVLGVVSHAAERARLTALTNAEAGVCWDRLLFCAKESVYKAWFPLTGRWLGFEDADVTIEPDGTFAARLLLAAPSAVPGVGPPLPTGFAGRWLVGGGLVLTAIAVPAAAVATGATGASDATGPGALADPIAAGAPGADAGGGFARGGVQGS
jgi:4'-phosphopantetheinyl transferase EntD